MPMKTTKYKKGARINNIVAFTHGKKPLYIGGKVYHPAYYKNMSLNTLTGALIRGEVFEAIRDVSAPLH